MAAEHKHLACHVLVAPGHARDPAPTPALQAVGIDFLPLDIPEVRHGQYAFLHRDEVFNIHLAADRLNAGAAFVGKFGADDADFFLDDGQDAFLMRQDVFKVGDFFHHGLQLVLNFLPFQAGKLP